MGPKATTVRPRHIGKVLFHRQNLQTQFKVFLLSQNLCVYVWIICSISKNFYVTRTLVCHCGRQGKWNYLVESDQSQDLLLLYHSGFQVFIKMSCRVLCVRACRGAATLGNLSGCITAPSWPRGQVSFELKKGEVAQRSCYGRTSGDGQGV